MNPMSKAKKSIEPRFYPTTKTFAFPLMTNWSGPAGKAVRRSEEDSDLILELLTSKLPAGTFDKVVTGVLLQLASDRFYDKVVRGKAAELVKLCSSETHRAF